MTHQRDAHQFCLLGSFLITLCVLLAIGVIFASIATQECRSHGPCENNNYAYAGAILGTLAVVALSITLLSLGICACCERNDILIAITRDEKCRNAQREADASISSESV